MKQRRQTTRSSPMARSAMMALGIGVALLIFASSSTAAAQDGQGRIIELETIEIESEVPRRVAQFFVQRDQLQYEQLDDQPSFIPDLMRSVDDDPF